MHTVLIVDDESEIRSSLQGVLEDEGYKTLPAESAEDALTVLNRKPVDVVLLDIWLPGIDGLGLWSASLPWTTRRRSS